MVAVKTARKTVLHQAIEDMRFFWCPVTANVPTRMTEAGFLAACAGFQEKAAMRHGTAQFQKKKYEICRTCKGETMPVGLEIIPLNKFKNGEGIKVATKKTNGTCEVCGRENMTVGKNNGVICCSGCTVLQAAIKKMPDNIVAEMQRLHGGKYFPAVDPDNDQQWARGVIQSVRHALGIDDGEDVDDLAAVVQERLVEVDTLETNFGKMANKMKLLQIENEDQHAIINDLSSPDLLPDDISETGADIVIKCDMLKKMLLEKNKSYGDSAMNPVRVFSRADPGEQLLVRIDDKLSRLSKGKEFAGDDTVMDLVGYLVLLLVQRDREEERGKREEEKAVLGLAG